MSDAKIPRSILITGCSSGIGLDAAQTLAREGWRVLATCRQQSDVARLQADGLESFRLDLADPQSTADGAAEALDRTRNRLFAVFNNGAFALPGAAEDLPRAALRETFETNVLGQFDLTNRLIPAMKANGGGRIVMNSSVLGFCVMPFRGAYAASKYALEALTDAMRLENRGTNLHVSLIEPGPIPSQIRVNSRAHFRRWIDPNRSFHCSAYQEKLIPALFDQDNTPSPFNRPPSAATDALRRALTDRRPKARYFVTPAPWGIWALRRMLNTRAMDYILSKG